MVEVEIQGARGVLINITGGPDITMAEIEEAAKTITERSAPDANIIFGTTIDKELKGKIKISVIATGFDNTKSQFYSSIKKPIPQIDRNPVTQQTPAVNSLEVKELSDHQIKKFLGDKDIPTGVDIVDEFDIPAFLRKNGV